MPKNESEPKTLVGCQAWGYDDWKTLRGGPTVFFPYGIRPEEKLSFYAKIFDTVEADTTFYGTPKVSDLENWHRQVPEDFIFSLKMPRDVTHAHSLSKSSFPFAEEFFRRLAVLKNKVGVVLIQLPQSFKMTRGTTEDLRSFLKFLPDEFRFAIEFRSPEWFDPEIFELLKKYNTALCLGENEFLSQEIMIKTLESPTADFAYFRFSGRRDLTKLDRVQRPHDESLVLWAPLVKKLQNEGRDCYVYFSNLFEGHSPTSAQKFRKLLGQRVTDPEEFNTSPSLF